MSVCLYFSLLVVPITIIKTKVFTTVPVVEQNCSSITFLYHLDLFGNSWYICGVGHSVVDPYIIFKVPINYSLYWIYLHCKCKLRC